MNLSSSLNFHEYHNQQLFYYLRQEFYHKIHLKTFYEKYKDAGIKDVSIHLYEGDRHEILNEVDRQNVYQDILAWIRERNKTKAEL